MEDIRGVRLRKFNLRKIILGVRMHFRHTNTNLHSFFETRCISYYTIVNHVERYRPIVSCDREWLEI